ncbi:MAG: hypothetical protein JXM73_13875 [Anaerolineae bacterium]|nr:hypothetical protein [Anaerolineae bacterium]
MNLRLEPIGQIHAVGTVQVFGYSVQRDRYREHLVYLNYAGPPTAAESVWARLVDRRLAVDYTDPQGRPHAIGRGSYAGLEGDEAPFKRIVKRIEHLAIDHYILLDKRFFMPDYDADTSQTFVFEDGDMAAKVGEHVSRCVDIPLFPEWQAGLLALGRRARLILPLHNYGGQPVWQVTLDRARWTQVIALAVEREELTWPGQEPAEAATRLLEEPAAQPEPEPAAAPATHPQGARRQPLLSVTLPERLSVQGWTVHAHNGAVQARGPGRSTRYHALPGSVATEADMAAIGDEIAREIETSPAEMSPGEAIPFTLTHEGDWTWLSFEKKPAEWVLTRLKSAGFRWGKKRRAWFSRNILQHDHVQRLLS